MSFMDKITSRPRDVRADTAAFDSQFDDVVTAYPEAPSRDAQAARSNPPPAADTRTGYEMQDSSIISEVTPSETAGDFSETRMQDPAIDEPAKGQALPLIGHLPVKQQQRVLIGLVGAGLLGLAMSVMLALSTASRSNEQLGAVGQALMESQRLAKSVSQAMVGTPSAFPEVKESAEVLSRNVRALAQAEGGGPSLPAAVQEAVDPLLPLVERADKNAAVVLAQQKALTEVGRSLRTINKQSAELLDTAETVASLKLQQGASAAEIAAMGQLVMLTQRIGKSASEFVTLEGVNPEAVYLLGTRPEELPRAGRGREPRQCAGARAHGGAAQAARRGAGPSRAPSWPT